MRVVGLASLCALAVLASCVSDGDTTIVTPSDDAGSDADASPVVVDGSTPPVDASTPTDAPAGCAAGTADCNASIPGCETNILADDANCGACAHDCGGTGLCKTGACTQLVISDKVASPVSLGVGGQSVFWMISGEIDRCPVTGCTGIATNVSDNFVQSTNGGGMFLCTTTGDCAGGPTRLLDQAQHLALNATTAFANQTTGTVLACDLTGCSGSGTTLATGENGITSLAATTTNLYWAIKGSGSAADGTIRSCALPDCKAGASTVVQSQAAPTSLSISGNFLYWVNKGTTTAGTGQIVRLRLP